jgi:hypothetical protein
MRLSPIQRCVMPGLRPGDLRQAAANKFVEAGTGDRLPFGRRSRAIEDVSEPEVCQAVARGAPELHIMDLEQVGFDCPSQRGQRVDEEPL